MGGTKCLICLNQVKPKIKKAARHSLEEQTLIVFLLKKLMWTPIDNDGFTQYLQVGNPSDWVVLCHICEKQAKEALDIHRQIMRMIYRIGEIRRKLYEETFYESDQEDEDGSVGGRDRKSIFFQLRRRLITDYRLNQRQNHIFRQSVVLKYLTNSNSRSGSCIDEHNDYDHQFWFAKKNVKNERMSDAEDNYSDSMAEEAVDAFFDQSVHFKGQRTETAFSLDELTSPSHSQVKREERYGKEGGEDPSISEDPPWRSSNKRKPRPRRFKALESLGIKCDKTPINVPIGCNKCPKCGKTFSNGSSMRRHYRENHLKSKDCKCPCCEETFARSEYLVRHLQQKHPERATDDLKLEVTKNFHCSLCPRKFRFTNALSRHIRRVHRATNLVYKCDQCENTYKRKDQLNNHIKAVHCDPNDLNSRDSEVAKRTCKICGKSFQSENVMIRHIKETHEKIKEHGCEFCSKFFARKSYLFRHIQNEHTENDCSNPILCKICKKQFVGEIALSRHMQSIHKQRQNVQCKICSRTYTQPAALNIHIRFAHGNEVKVSETSSDEVNVNNTVGVVDS